MARLSTIDDNERRKYQDFNRRTYGTSLEASQNDRRRSRKRLTGTDPITQSTEIQPKTEARSTQKNRTKPRRQTARRTRRRPVYRPNRIDRRAKATVATNKKSVSLAARWLIRLLSLGFLFIPQVIMTIMTLVGLGALTVLDSTFFSRLVLAFGGDVIEGTIMVTWFLMISIGWLNIVIVLLVFKTIGVRSLLGEQAGIKISLFIASLVLYTIPAVNLIPWCFVWAEYVFHHPD